MASTLRWGAGVLALVVASATLASSPAAGVAGFGDVPDDSFFTEAVQWMVDEEITSGIAPGCFGPQYPVTRGQLAAFMWRMEGSPPPASIRRYVDVRQQWQIEPVSWMAEQGISSGVGGGAFAPERALTRGEFAVLMWRLAGRPSAPPHPFVDIADPAQDMAVSWMRHRGVTTGTGPTTFSPGAGLNRGQLATFFHRYNGSPAVRVDPGHPAWSGCAGQAPAPDSVRFAAVGDLGASEEAAAVFDLVGDLDTDALFLAGDLSYGDIEPERAWCDFVRRHTGPEVPIAVVAGNHEDDNGGDGFIRNFAKCLPATSLDPVGDYGVQFYVDLGDLVRVIAISPDLRVDGVEYQYRPGSPERRWLERVAGEAKSAGRWVVVMQHKPCFSAAEKFCAVSRSLTGWEAANADVVVLGHSHTYQRSHQMPCFTVDRVAKGCIADRDGDHQRGDGTVFLINGLGGRDRPVNRSDSETGYFARLLGTGDNGLGHGVVEFEVTDRALTATFVGADTTWTDTFTIHR